MKKLIALILLFSIQAMGSEDLAVVETVNSWNSLNNPEFVQKKILKQDQESDVIALKLLKKIKNKDRSVTEYKALLRGEDLYKTSSIQTLEP